MASYIKTNGTGQGPSVMAKNGTSIASEPKPEGWGGSWTEKKLVAFEKYVKAYLTIMAKNPYWKTIYFDGFAGSGNARRRKTWN
ncbi:MAG: hypothetical protein IPI55_02165 [Flavobacteriales bacterium]|nr:hypothetical protein [Flavobacteriales bacterium]